MLASITLIFLHLSTDNSLLSSTVLSMRCHPSGSATATHPLPGVDSHVDIRRRYPSPLPYLQRWARSTKKSIRATPTLGIPKERTDKAILSLYTL